VEVNAGDSNEKAMWCEQNAG